MLREVMQVNFQLCMKGKRWGIKQVKQGACDSPHESCGSGGDRRQFGQIWYMSLWWQLHPITTSQSSCKTCNLHDFFFVFCWFFFVEISQGFSLHLSISKLPHTDITFAPHLVCWHFSPLINTPAEMMGLLVGVHVLKYAKNALFSAGAGGLHRNHLNQYKWEADEFWTFDHTLNVTLHLISGMFKD